MAFKVAESWFLRQNEKAVSTSFFICYFFSNEQLTINT